MYRVEKWLRHDREEEGRQKRAAAGGRPDRVGNDAGGVFPLGPGARAQSTGTTSSNSPGVSVKNHHQLDFNPKSMYQKETPLEEVVSAEMIAIQYKTDVFGERDGAAAAVLNVGAACP